MCWGIMYWWWHCWNDMNDNCVIEHYWNPKEHSFIYWTRMPKNWQPSLQLKYVSLLWRHTPQYQKSCRRDWPMNISWKGCLMYKWDTMWQSNSLLFGMQLNTWLQCMKASRCILQGNLRVLWMIVLSVRIGKLELKCTEWATNSLWQRSTDRCLDMISSKRSPPWWQKKSLPQSLLSSRK